MENNGFIHLEESHVNGLLTIETIPKPGIVDFGIQISMDGRVWICIDSVPFIRFKPTPGQKLILENLGHY